MLQGMLAEFNPASVIWIFIPLAPFIIGGVAILVKHQQRMAEILHGAPAQLPSQELVAMQEQLSQMQQQLTQVTLALEDLKRPPIDQVQSRIGERLNH